MDLLSIFDQYEEVNVLDLGSGIGRNSIHIAQHFQEKKGKIVCVDLLESAICKLKEYGAKFGVDEKIERFLSDIADFSIAELRKLW